MQRATIVNRAAIIALAGLTACSGGGSTSISTLPSTPSTSSGTSAQPSTSANRAPADFIKPKISTAKLGFIGSAFDSVTNEDLDISGNFNVITETKITPTADILNLSAIALPRDVVAVGQKKYVGLGINVAHISIPGDPIFPANIDTARPSISFVPADRCIPTDPCKIPGDPMKIYFRPLVSGLKPL
jgi:hypothetical protein